VTVQTNSQKMAQIAYQRIENRKPTKEFRSFAREFPTLVHSCGLAQAVAFAQAKKKQEHHVHYLEDLTKVLSAISHGPSLEVDALAKATRDLPIVEYLRLSRDALTAAIWLKRYVEAAATED
jgi:CRISPR-associated protein Cmr5